MDLNAPHKIDKDWKENFGAGLKGRKKNSEYVPQTVDI